MATNRAQRSKTKTKQESNSRSNATTKNRGDKPLRKDSILRTVETARFIVGLTVLVVALFLLLSFASHMITCVDDADLAESAALGGQPANYGGPLGALAAHFFMDEGFGLCAFLLPAMLLLLSVKMMQAYKPRLWKWFINFTILLVWGSVALSTLVPDALTDHFTFSFGGGHGQRVSHLLTSYIGQIGTVALVGLTALLYAIYLSRETMNLVRHALRPQDCLHRRAGGSDEHPEDSGQPNSKPEMSGNTLPETEEEPPAAESLEEDQEPAISPEEDQVSVQAAEGADTAIAEDNSGIAFVVNEGKDGFDSKENQMQTPTEFPDCPDTAAEPASVASEPYDPRLDLADYQPPTIDLLRHYTDEVSATGSEELQSNKNRIIEVLGSFGVQITRIVATVGPTVTLYEITPAPGVRISKIRNLESDIALSLAALGIRIIAPIPGKGTIGIEVPNKKPRIVSMESILSSRGFQESRFALPIALGKTILGEAYVADLSRMPHLLVAGATGQGKSVGLNAIITSLLYKKHPSELKFVMVDPKKVEFSLYSKIERHFLAKIPDEGDAIITDVDRVKDTLRSLCRLMDHRYDLLKLAQVRNIGEYNERFRQRLLSPANGHEFMPYIVVIIDEFGDLIMTAGKEVELPIVRIAQLARAVGIHMVIATQRPTVNIITGTIKANFPARMAFKVSAQVDSKTILDQPGANQLIGRGDMLIINNSEPVRVQCAFVDTPEVERINDFIAGQQGYLTAYELPDPPAEGKNDSPVGDDDFGETDERDPLFDAVAHYVVEQQTGSTSNIQRKFSIGYNRAGRIADQLEAAGITGPQRGSKPRDVLISDTLELERLLH